MRQRWIAGVLVGLALTACGSTVQVQSAVGSGDGLSQGTTGTDLGGSSGTVSGTSGAGGTTGSLASGTRGTSGTTGGSTSTGAQLPSSAPTLGGSTSGPGSAGGPKKPVEIGIVIYPDVGAAAKALGGSADVGDQQAEAQTSVNWINAHGGLAGHKVVPVYFEVSLTSTQPYSATYQQICSKFTEDHHVIATVFIGNAENGLPNCLRKGKSLMIAQGHYLHTAEEYQALTNLVTTQDAGSDRIARAMADEIIHRNLLKPGETLGLLVMDYAGPQKAANQIIIPAMKAKGIKVLSYTINYPQSTPAISQSASAVQSAELQMASRGVKNVAFMCPGCVTFFLQYAESQGYHPRYIVSSLDGLLGIKGKGHGASFGNAVALGWNPIQDVGTFGRPGLLAANPTYTKCLQIQKGNYSGDQSLYAAVALCSAFLDLLAAAEANPVATPTWTSLLAGFNSLGAKHAGAANLSTVLAGNRHDGVASYKTLHYDAGCDCFAYDSGPAKAFP
jgi:hypothetical protein